MQWLEENRDVEPFFLLVDSFDPHEPWDPPREYADLYDPGYSGREIITPRYGASDYLSEAELKTHARPLCRRGDHGGPLAGPLPGPRSRAGHAGGHPLVVTSDHGHQIGEHDLTGKVSWGLWYELMDVPLFVRLPDGARAGTRVDAFAQHHDIAPTVLKALGVEPAAPLDGVEPLGVGGRPRRATGVHHLGLQQLCLVQG